MSCSTVYPGSVHACYTRLDTEARRDAQNALQAMRSSVIKAVKARMTINSGLDYQTV